MSKLPKLFKNININPMDNNKKQVKVKENTMNIEEVLNKVFNIIKNPYNTKVLIKTNTINKETYIVYRNKETITTLDNEVIPIKDINYLEIK